MKKTKKTIKKKQEKGCKHEWAALLAKRGRKILPVSVVKICLKCGEMKMGAQTVKISRFRLSIEGGTKLKIPVGTNMYN